ncbi:MAG: undecaprenyldiphospho-muramoylpentapeptide beta-N-acetylglucosaminyltransferase [Cytophagales bacterium]
MTKRFIISGGGTGGHIFPALAIAEALKESCHDAEFLFVGATGRMEMTKIPEAGYEIVGLNIAGFQRKNLLKNLTLPFKLIKSLFQAYSILKKFKPNAAVGVGGYASGPLLFVAGLLGVPCLIQEQNSYAGVTNRILAGFAKKICVAYEGMDRFFPKRKIVFTGNPVRKNLQDVNLQRLPAMLNFKLSSEKKTILVIGGSLGAKTINEAVALGLEKLIQNDIQLIWQTGKTYFEKASELTKPKPLSNGWGDVKVFDFIKRMDWAYAAADLVISRAGALSVSELALIGKPCILVPSPNVSEDHQTMNALSLAQHHAAVLVKDAEAKEVLIEKAIELIKNEEEMNLMSEKIKHWSKPNAATEIAEWILKISKK